MADIENGGGDIATAEAGEGAHVNCEYICIVGGTTCMVIAVSVLLVLLFCFGFDSSSNLTAAFRVTAIVALIVGVLGLVAGAWCCLLLIADSLFDGGI
jgi:hypothetical protein